MKKIVLIAGLISQVIVCSDVAVNELEAKDIACQFDQYMKDTVEQELADVALQLDDLRRLLAHQEATPSVQMHTRQDLRNLVSMLEKKFVETVELFSNEKLSPEDAFVVAQELFKASCQPLLVQEYLQD